MTEGISLYLYLVLPGVVETPTRVEVRCGWCVKPWQSLLADHGPLSAAPPDPEVRDA
jgi:hypothetical protein